MCEEKEGNNSSNLFEIVDQGITQAHEDSEHEIILYGPSVKFSSHHLDGLPTLPLVGHHLRVTRIESQNPRKLTFRSLPLSLQHHAFLRH